MGHLFPEVEGPMVAEAINGEAQERFAHLTALPKHVAARQHKHLIRVTNDRLLSDLSITAAEREGLTRAECLVLSLDTAVSGMREASFQTGWLRRLGVGITPGMERRMPMLKKEDVAELLRALYPPSYHHERDWRVLGDGAAWQEWLGSVEYQEALGCLPARAQSRLRTRRRSSG
jgi:hypothetical protein